MNAVKSLCFALFLSQVVLHVLVAGVTTEKSKPGPCLTNIQCTGYCQPVRDKNGCYTCECPTLTCANVDCAPGFVCVMKQLVFCFTTPCFPSPVCEPIEGCPKIDCPTCSTSLDSNGCPVCDCRKTCDDTVCADDEICVMQDVICKKEPCYPQPTCVPRNESETCKRAVCKRPCVPDIGPDGCYSVCACPKTCEDIKCNKDEVCELHEVLCIRAPCFPIPTCVPKNKTCSESPNNNHCNKDVSYQWTYNSSANTCQTFPYYGCTPSPNTFNTRRQCTNTCVRPVKLCPIPLCRPMENCYQTQGTPDSCPECVCPCQTVKCSRGFECRLTKVECSEEPCYPQAGCVPIIKKCPPVCAIHCPNGHKLDENGCPTCECKDEIIKECPPVCAIWCPNGNKLDQNGCPTCTCNEGGSIA